MSDAPKIENFVIGQGFDVEIDGMRARVPMNLIFPNLENPWIPEQGEELMLLGTKCRVSGVTLDGHGKASIKLVKV
jgi:hypothetical protein